MIYQVHGDLSWLCNDCSYEICDRFIAETTLHVSYDCFQKWQVNGASVEVSWCGSWWICPVNLALANLVTVASK